MNQNVADICQFIFFISFCQSAISQKQILNGQEEWNILLKGIVFFKRWRGVGGLQ